MFHLHSCNCYSKGLNNRPIGCGRIFAFQNIFHAVNKSFVRKETGTWSYTIHFLFYYWLSVITTLVGVLVQKNTEAKGVQFFHTHPWFLIFLLYQIIYAYASIATWINCELFALQITTGSIPVKMASVKIYLPELTSKDNPLMYITGVTTDQVKWIT